jgi:CRP-like cAMP-binding protein
MTPSPLLPLLQKHPFVRGFSPAQVERLATHAKAVRFNTDHVIFREGEETPEFYLVVQGKVALEIASHGDTFRVETVSGGDELGWSSVLAGKGKLFQARTLESVDLLAFNGDELRAMFASDPAFGYEFLMHLLRVVAERLESTRLQVVDMYWPPAKRAGA